jgi:hypothetical protein
MTCHNHGRFDTPYMLSDLIVAQPHRFGVEQ